MKFVCDLHLHSKYSRAVSQNMTLANMAQWAKMKGINVLATGDFTHPFWFDQLKKELLDEGNGLFKLKDEFNKPGGNKIGAGFADMKQDSAHFMLSCEIASIYSQGGKSRRIHTLFFFPSLESVEKFNKELIRRGSNLRSDGRPIVGIPSDVLAEIAFSVDGRAMVIPAHVWTPWFSLYGSFSGFDSIEECFGKAAERIYGIETGLSSDPEMNWQIGDLDGRSILSFSDAHSLEKMGREATVLDGPDISYESIFNAIAQKEGAKVALTMEFWPEEGKYHFTGHRDCGVSLSPDDSAKAGNICPVCNRNLTVGVMQRVCDLKSRDISVDTRVVEGTKWMHDTTGLRPPYVSLVPLLEILSEVFGSAVGTKRVSDAYLTLINALGSEFNILLKANIEEIRRLTSDRVAEAISKVRSRDIVVEPGYDGKFGVVKIYNEERSTDSDTVNEESQLNLFV